MVLATTEGTINVTGTGKTFASVIGGSSKPLSTITISAGQRHLTQRLMATTISANAASTFTGAVTATTFGTTAAAYNIAINGGGTITNAATFSNIRNTYFSWNNEHLQAVLLQHHQVQEQLTELLLQQQQQLLI